MTKAELEEALAWVLANGVKYVGMWDEERPFRDGGCGCCSGSIDPPKHLRAGLLEIAQR